MLNSEVLTSYKPAAKNLCYTLIMNIVGHRGVAGHAPENTLASFKKAIALGCKRTEFDLRLSRDGQPVVIHDRTVDRTTDGTGAVSELDMSEIKKLNCDLGQKIPTLQEAVDVCKGRIDLQIELKAPGTARAACESIVRNQIIDNVLVTSFTLDYLVEIKKFSSLIRIGLLLKGVPDEKLWDSIKGMSLDYICPEAPFVSKGFVNIAHEKGLKVYVYGVNDVAAWERMEKFGVDDIGTDFPDLASRGK